MAKMNDDELKILVTRVALAQAMGQMHDGKRNVYDSCGWPVDIVFQQYMDRYRRQGMARRVINAPVGAVWRGKPDIQEIDTPGTETQFEKDLKNLIEDKKLYQYCARVDRLAGIGSYAVLFLGLSGDDDLVEEIKPNKSNKLMYFSLYSQQHAEIKEFEEDPTNERFGLPKLYDIDFSRSGTREGPQQVVTRVGKKLVHWSRVVHVADELLEGEIFGTPRLECVWNNLLSLELITGGSGEMYWQGAFPGFGFRAQPDADFGTEEREAMVEQIENYFHGLQRYLRLRGVDIDQLAPQVSDPTAHIDTQITQISAATGIPKRILTGSERGELASSQDQENWEDRVDERRRDFAEPVILRPLIDRLIELEAIAEPKNGYELVWPDIKALSEKERTDINKERVTMLKDYMSTPGTDTMIPEDIFMREFLVMDENTIEECMESIEEYWREQEKQEDEDRRVMKEEVEPDQETVEMVQNMLKGLYRADQPRDERGRWTSGGGGSSGDVEGTTAEFVERSKIRSAARKISRFQESYKAKYGDMSKTSGEAVKNSARNAEELHSNAVAIEQDFRDVMHGAADAAGGEAYFGPRNPKTGGDFAIKDYDSLSDKISRRGKPVDDISDAIRGTVIVPDVRDLKSAVDTVVSDVESRGGKIVKIDDKYANPAVDGYVGIHVDAAFNTPGGGTILAEIQVHDHNFTYKEQSHVLYEQNRKGEIDHVDYISKTVDMYNQWYQKVI